MGLATNLKIFFPETPSPPDPKVLEISTALDLAIVQHIVTTYIPTGFGQTFLAGISSPTAIIASLAAYLTTTLSPILSAALAAESTPGSSHLLAWGVIQPSFDTLSAASPPFLGGPDGLRLWQAIVLTIRTGLIPEFPPPPEIDTDISGGDGIITLEDGI